MMTGFLRISPPSMFRGRTFVAMAAVGLGLTAGMATVQTAHAQSYYSDFLALDPVIAERVDAAARFGGHMTIFFHDNVAQLHSSSEVSSLAMFDATSIPDWPAGWDHVDAAYAADDTYVALIRGGMLAWLAYDEANTQTPLSIAGEPVQLFAADGPLPADWQGSIDAALSLGDGRLMFFKGVQDVTVAVAEDGTMTFGEPGSLRDWPGWPADWDRIDAAANPGFGLLYFFRDGAYVAWDMGTDAMAPFAPQSMAPGAPLQAAISDRLYPVSRSELNKPVNLKISNRTNQELEILWVDFKGDLKPYARLIPFTEYVQQTGDGHLWYARQGDDVVASYRASTDDEQHFMVFDQPQIAIVPAKEQIIDPNLYTDKSGAILPYPNSDWLGAGFDLAYVDPANLGAVGPLDNPTTARRRSPFSLMLSARRSADGRYMLPHGVTLASSSTTADDDRERIITSVEDLSEELNLGLSQGVDVGIAAFSRALSYEHVNNSSTGRSSIFMYHRVLAKNDRIQLELAWPDGQGHWQRQRLDPGFEVQVARLGATCREGYDQLLAAYGSHYAKSVQFGGQYTMLTKVNKSSFNRFEGNKAAFEQHLRVTIPDTPISVSSGQSASGGRSEGSANTDEFNDVKRFISGGEGFSSRDAWMASLAQKPAPVDILFAPSTELLTGTFFPNDPRIYAKQEMLRDCAEAHYASLGQSFESHAARGAEPFFQKEIPPELKKKSPDYRYLVDARIVDSKAQCNQVSPEWVAWTKEMVRNITSGKGPPPMPLLGRMDIFVDFNLNYGGAFTGAKYLCLSADGKGQPLTRLYPISHNAASGTSSCKAGDRRLATNINDKWNNWGQSDYICVGSNANEYPLYDVKIRAVVGAMPDYTHQASSAGMVLNAGDILLYLHTQDVRQARDAGRIGGQNVDFLANLEIR